MAPSFANLSPHARAASLAAELDSLRAKVNGASAPNQPAEDPAAAPAPKKKPRSTVLADAKKILRASTAVTSKSLAAPEFVQRPPDIARHRRKCAVCHHPEREIIEDLFIHWHSPATIGEYYDDDGTGVNWVSIYRHAYAFGLDEVRRRNLRFAFELIIEQAADIHATPAAIIASARALGTCVNPDGHWNEPERRVRVVNHIYHHDASASTNTAEASVDSQPPSSRAFVGADRSHRPASSLCPDEVENGSSFRATYPRDVVASQFAYARPDDLDMETIEKPFSICALHPPVLSEVEGRDVVSAADEDGVSKSASARTGVPATAPVVPICSDKVENSSSFRACPDSSIGAPHPRDVVSGDEIRNSRNSFKSKEPPISNR